MSLLSISKSRLTTPEIKDSMRKNLTQMRAILSLQFRREELKNESFESPLVSNLEPSASLGGVLTLFQENLHLIATQQGSSLDCVIPQWSFRVFVPLWASDLHRVLLNLGENAIHSAVKGENQVVIDLKKMENQVQISIRDFGLGFSKKAMNAFLKNKSFTDKVGGSGKGLLSVKRILASTKGSLEIRSEKTGTLANILLPMVETPPWYFDFRSDTSQEIIILDDYEEVSLQLKPFFPLAHIQAFHQEDLFLQAKQAYPEARLLIDYNYAGQRTGLDLILEEKLGHRAVLFTGRAHFDSALLSNIVQAGVKVLPKECLF